MKESRESDREALLEEVKRLRALVNEDREHAKARLVSILETAVEGIITIDERGVIDDFNPAAAKIFGYSRSEVVGKNVKLLMPEPYHSQHDDYIESYQKSGKAQIIGVGREVVGRRKNGSVFPMDLAVSEIDLPSGRIYCGFVRDVSERRELEREVLAIGDRERTRIGQDLHDDLGQQLTGIEFMCQTLEQTLRAKAVEEADSVGEISKLVRSAIAHTRRLARGLSPVILDPGGLVPALEELAEISARQFKIRCECHCPRRIEVEDEAAAGHLYRIAQEAIQNAMKHGRASAIDIGITKTPERLVLSVRDDGVGIPRKLPKKSGMGLRIMQYRAGLIGGSIVVQRNFEGRGTSVVCTVHLRSRGANYDI